MGFAGFSMGFAGFSMGFAGFLVTQVLETYLRFRGRRYDRRRQVGDSGDDRHRKVVLVAIKLAKKLKKRHFLQKKHENHLKQPVFFFGKNTHETKASKIYLNKTPGGKQKALLAVGQKLLLRLGMAKMALRRSSLNLVESSHQLINIQDCQGFLVKF